MKLNLSLLEDIAGDVEFCLKLAREESVIVLPGNKHEILFNMSSNHFIYNLVLELILISYWRTDMVTCSQYERETL